MVLVDKQESQVSDHVNRGASLSDGGPVSLGDQETKTSKILLTMFYLAAS